MDNNRDIILCSGSGMDVFLNDLLSCTLPESGALRYGFLLNSGGRVMSDLFLWCHDQAHFLLDCPKEDTESLCQELMQRNFDAGLKLTLPKSLNVETSAAQPEYERGWSAQDPRHPEMGWRTILEHTAPIIDTGYTARRLGLGIPEGAEDLPRAEALPLEYGLEDAIDFTKGCFMGQEVCTRMHRMGTGKFSVRAFHSDAEVSKGTVLGNATHPKVGTVISSYGKTGFVRLHIARFAAEPVLQINGTSIRIV